MYLYQHSNLGSILQCFASHLQNLGVVVNLTLVAALPCRGSPLGEVAALVQEEQRFSVLFF